MLSKITIQNFALIQQLHLSLGKGLQVITGETGAGKSIKYRRSRIQTQ